MPDLLPQVAKTCTLAGMPSGANKQGSERLAARLRSLRGHLTQQEACVVAGISLATWQNLERGNTRAQPATLRRIAEGFDVDQRELYDLVSDTPVDERFTDAELDRLAERLAPLIARRLAKLDPKR
jgi:transcriptional regulator with XRE-family HTH domain